MNFASAPRPPRRRRRQSLRRLTSPALHSPMQMAATAAISSSIDWLNPVSPRWSAVTSATNSCEASSTKDSSVTVSSHKITIQGYFPIPVSFSSIIEYVRHLFFFLFFSIPRQINSLWVDSPSNLLRHWPPCLPAWSARTCQSPPQ